MLSRSQEKLLRYLGGFPDALAQAWDVPRDVSLPGLSDAMGVVRSGLNQPLNVLLDQKYITVRVAHVIGGGARRRQVYHITEAGRAWLHEHPESIVEEQPSLPVEERVHHPLIGRTQELEELTNLVEERGHALVGGLSGVGKTTLLRAWGANQSDVVRWATVDELSDAEAIAGQWMADSSPLPKDPDAMVEHVNAASGVLVVDDVHRLSERHLDAVVHLLDALRDRGHRVVLAGRLPV
ncbi:MAG: AAA family ATPase, partial [Candidatus Poseidoniales archaeon]